MNFCIFLLLSYCFDFSTGLQTFHQSDDSVVSLSKMSSNPEMFMEKTSQYDVQLVTYHLNDHNHGHLILPWVSHPSALPHAMPFCFSEDLNHQDSIVRLAHVICRHRGYMIATKWFPTSKEFIPVNSTGVTAFCRGDEQLIDHCQWHHPSWQQCNYYLSIECGECSDSFHLSRGSRITLASPSFPVYIPLVTCEWNITLPPEFNLMIGFEQFDLPTPVYDISCRLASLEILSYREDINKMVLDGRFCGRHSNGNLTIFSNRVLIRFTAGTYKTTVFSKNGFIAECSMVASGHATSDLQLIVRCVLIGCAVTLTTIIALFLLAKKGRLCGIRHRRRCWEDAISVTTISDPDRLASSQSSRQSLPARSPRRSFYQRSHSDTKSPFEGQDLKHWQQTHRLAKWRSARSYSSGNRGKAEEDSGERKDDSHVYEEIDLTLHNQQNQIEPVPVGKITLPTAVISPHSNSFVRLYESSRVIPYLPLSPSATATAALVPEPVATARVSPRIVVQPVQPTPRPRLNSNASALWPPPYFRGGSNESVSSSSVSGIYIDPDSDQDM